VQDFHRRRPLAACGLAGGITRKFRGGQRRAAGWISPAAV
jgi:hypothetical protein